MIFFIPGTWEDFYKVRKKSLPNMMKHHAVLNVISMLIMGPDKRQFLWSLHSTYLQVSGVGIPSILIGLAFIE